jgi:hypothetical protein
MSTIKAEGKFQGNDLSVICVKEDEELFFLFNRSVDKGHESVFKNILKERHSIAGTFFPEEESMLNVLNVIQYHFFDEKPSSVEVEGDIGEIPFEPDMIY